MTSGAALAGGFLGALVLGAGLDAAAQARLTRLDLPLLLGTAVFRRRVPARAFGYALHLAAGLAFASVYGVAGVTGWVQGSLVGLVHGLLAVGLLFPVGLPLVHARLRGPAFVEPPGFLLRNYGAWTALLLVALHAAYGCLVGGFVALAA